MALPKKAVATLPFALGAAALGSSKSGRDAMGALSTKLGLKAAEKPLRNFAGKPRGMLGEHASSMQVVFMFTFAFLN